MSLVCQMLLFPFVDSCLTVNTILWLVWPSCPTVGLTSLSLLLPSCPHCVWYHAMILVPFSWFLSFCDRRSATQRSRASTWLQNCIRGRSAGEHHWGDSAGGVWEVWANWDDSLGEKEFCSHSLHQAWVSWAGHVPVRWVCHELSGCFGVVD